MRYPMMVAAAARDAEEDAERISICHVDDVRVICGITSERIALELSKVNMLKWVKHVCGVSRRDNPI